MAWTVITAETLDVDALDAVVAIAHAIGKPYAEMTRADLLYLIERKSGEVHLWDTPANQVALVLAQSQTLAATRPRESWRLENTLPGRVANVDAVLKIAMRHLRAWMDAKQLRVLTTTGELDYPDDAADFYERALLLFHEFDHEGYERIEGTRRIWTFRRDVRDPIKDERWEGRTTIRNPYPREIGKARADAGRDNARGR